MLDYTDFIVRVGGVEVEFRHEAKTVGEFFNSKDGMIYDVFGSQMIKRSDISSVRLDPRPYAKGYMAAFGRSHDGLISLWVWVNSLSEAEKADILKRFR